MFKILFLGLGLLVSSLSFAALQVGDTLPSLCWTAMDGTQICSDKPAQVHVLMYNAGYCGPCNQEFSEVIPKLNGMDTKGIAITSLSIAGWNAGEPADATFLGEWKAKHDIPFTVATANRNELKLFDEIPGIPTTVVTDAFGKITYLSLDFTETSSDELIAHLRKSLLGSQPPP